MYIIMSIYKGRKIFNFNRMPLELSLRSQYIICLDRIGTYFTLDRDFSAVRPQGLVTIQVNILSMYKHIQGRTSFFTPRVPNFRFFLGGAVTFTLGPCCSLLG